MALLNVGSHPSHSTPSLFFSLAITKTSGNQSLSFPEFYCKQIETRDINFRLDNRKHPACRWSSFSSHNNTSHCKNSFSFPEIQVVSDYRYQPDFVTSIKIISATKHTHRKLNEDQNSNLPINVNEHLREN